MSADVIKLNYPAMTEMAEHCKMVAQRLQDTAKMGQSTAGKLEAGALIGQCGSEFSSTLRDGFTPAVTRLSQKFEELARDIQAAMDLMKSQDQNVGGTF
jgi:WXG100 family type VII secretion target